MTKPAMSVADLEEFLNREFPQAFHPGSGLSIEEVEHGRAVVRLAYSEKFVRPGGTISGPTMMMLADFALYLAVLSAIGPVALAVTINFNINFLRRPDQRALIADAAMLKLGKRLAVMEVTLYSEGSEEPVAHVTSTYSIPPNSGA
ncbi:PaaI family thioesterase [Pseudorhodoplanes sp.]|uniref:PaaI family thioesterase n=1 Tax=Pseudorhodoplanes sp. TaxID=1934341 RepID=UPI002B6BA594|nr:PaaI family thioesterase [Pseudorhodoplanes sp.]HWV51336.1 PaaI family thioesterase [Pseudorhodoplanes sp.]